MAAEDITFTARPGQCLISSLMVARSSTDTPLMRQYLDIKAKYEDAILLFRMGDFYEMFFDDAVVAARALELTLTSRDKNSADPVPLAGVPHHAINGYIRKLLDQGFKVAVCDQVEDPKLAKGLVKRAVTRVITPGVVLDTDQLEAKANNFLVVIIQAADQDEPVGYGLAALDLSTFELRATQVETLSGLADELARLSPREVIHPPTPGFNEARKVLSNRVNATWDPMRDELRGDEQRDGELVEEKGEGRLARMGLGDAPLAVEACAAALRYAASTQPGIALPACRVVSYRAADHLQLDESTLANLEIFETLMERKRKGSLLWVLDRTRTAMGGRQLRHLLAMPLLDVGAIRRRLDAVELLVDQASLRRDIQERLAQVHDLERLTSRVVLKAASPREVGRLAASLRQLPKLVELIRQAAQGTLDRELPGDVDPPEDLLVDVAAEIQRTLVDEPPVLTKEGKIIRRGFCAELDEYVDLAEGGKESILAIEVRERERTGIASLKVRFNRVFGYFIEVPRARLDQVPEAYQRKQTLVNAERFVTPELAQHEARVLGAEEKRITLEIRLFEQLRAQVARDAGRLRRVARWVAHLDLTCGLAEVAQEFDYVRPEVDDGPVIHIEQGRHPVVERFMESGQFVPNDLTLDPRETRLAILTGPNMAGKSTVMRQVALITVMAQLGSFVPARKARIGIVDRIFTRVGASDNLARGESTFMVEMREMSTILRHATSSSLVVVDEIGRGTSTYDGISIAWAVAEFLQDRVAAKCLFATHYHELCALSEVRPLVRNFNIAVQEWKGGVVFLRRLVPGGSSRSYGIEVARLAGLPDQVVTRARQVLAALEGGEQVDGIPARAVPEEGGSPQLSLFDRLMGSGTAPAVAQQPHPALTGQEQRALDQLRALDINRMTPLQALTTLAALAAALDKK